MNETKYLKKGYYFKLMFQKQVFTNALKIYVVKFSEGSEENIFYCYEETEIKQPLFDNVLYTLLL